MDPKDKEVQAEEKEEKEEDIRITSYNLAVAQATALGWNDVEITINEDGSFKVRSLDQTDDN